MNEIIEVWLGCVLFFFIIGKFFFKLFFIILYKVEKYSYILFEGVRVEDRWCSIMKKYGIIMYCILFLYYLGRNMW